MACRHFQSSDDDRVAQSAGARRPVTTGVPGRGRLVDSSQQGIPAQRSGTMPIPPRHFVPRARLWERLDESTHLGVPLLIGPVGSGKTLGIAGWLRYRGHDRGDAVWIHGDAGLNPDRLRSVLRAATHGPVPVAEAGARPRLVVIDDAHALPSASLRPIDEILQKEPA